MTHLNWHNFIVQKNPSNYKSYQRGNKSWFVVDTSFEFEVLLLHKELLEFFLQKHYYYNLEKALQLNANVGYVHLQNNALDKSSWIPLLSGYIVYTSLGGNFFKLSIKREENSLQYFWQGFGKDSTFTYCNV
ncbi:hypothetical protein RhiirA5_439849 [Rhizophagus irregularis]|uniref:Uncharacterized protein n=2 Tax=Rhizophagus irregularis TaxID=588596 RepID=A0A2N0NHD2_9GLOM|nr:hypothetical protein RirG_251840 [Rhizophagus irregularis DAOM 197198w]PKB93987.1 hypothetical protein RhiirA5_439849 [Rhizophagus irregularis]GBC46444.1 hypothetical protein GLOIN_2v1801635 [Rhizophagus irregularis DAOM 181602=DAOM 197198]CAB5130191.1 unnamed protein product [Rhizophagus irregularis]